MAAGKGGLALLMMGKPKTGTPAEDDDSSEEMDEASDMDACHDVWDAVQAKDEDAFCRALAAAIKAYK